MFNNPDDIKIDDISLGTAVCKDEQEMEYHQTAVVFFLSCGLFIPFCVIVLLVIIISSSCSELRSAIDKEENHANLAALVFTELLFSTFVVIVDIVALCCVNPEFSSYSNFSQGFAIATTVLDAVAMLIAYFILLCFGLTKIGLTKIGLTKIGLIKIGLTKIGLTKIALLCCRKKCLEDKKAWTTLILVICSTPLFSLAFHSGYIIAAWLSDTQHAGPVTFFYLISFLYCFIIFRQLYKFCNSLILKVRHCKKTCFCFFIILKFLLGSIFLVGPQVFVMYSLIVLPLTVTTAPTVGSLAAFPGRTRTGNEANVFHLAFLIITGFFTYKFIYTEDEPKQFMNAFITHLRNKNIKDLDLKPPDAEAAGRVVGEVASTIIQRKCPLT